MSWNFRKAGTNAATLAAAIRDDAASGPVEVRERCAKQVEAVKLQSDQVIVVQSSGHYADPTQQPLSQSTETTTVLVMSLIA